MRLRLVTYNIHAGIGSDGRFEPGRLIDILRQLDADIIALQEVVTLGPDRFALLNELAQACAMEVVPGPTMMRGDTSYGNALLSRYPPQHVRRLTLDYLHYEPRGALSLALKGHGHPSLTVAVTHLGLRGGERRAQIERLLNWLPPAPAPVVLMGDFNEWLPWSRALARLQQRFECHPGLRTFPARLPLLPLDRIMAAPSGMVRTVRRILTPQSRLASDHLPLVAELRL